MRRRVPATFVLLSLLLALMLSACGKHDAGAADAECA